MVEVTSPDAIGEPAVGASLNESSDQAEQEGSDTSTNESARNSAAGKLVTLGGPAINSILSLRDGSEDGNVLTVYQDPSSDSAHLSLIERRQLISLPCY